jgi:uncharacterized protein YoxC
MPQTPTVEQFLAEQSSELDDVEADLGPVETVLRNGDPLASIAESLQTLVGMVTAHTEDEQLAERRLELLDDLEAKYDELHSVLATIEKIVAKSTSKVSLDVKAAINAWRNPEVTATEPMDEPGPEVVESEASVEADARPDQPAHDAAVDEWRAYCRALRPAEFLPTTLDTMNRSQIRTFLGIEQVEA